MPVRLVDYRNDRGLKMTKTAIISVAAATIAAFTLAACGDNNSNKNQPAPPPQKIEEQLPFTEEPEDFVFFRKRCGVCHSTEQYARHRVGPNLFGVVGRGIGMASEYNYSAALVANRHRLWDEAALDEFLKDPRAFAPNNRMAFPGLKDDAERRMVIAYLKKLKP